jgi:hypothetical protein
MKKIFAAALLAGSAFAMTAPASAMTVDRAAGVTKNTATKVAWYCDNRGRCVRGPRAGYVVRNGWDPGCPGVYEWNGAACIAPVVVAPPVYVAPAPVYVAPGPVVKVKPNGTIVEQRANGTVVKVKPNGDVVKVKPNGTVVYQ